MAGEGFPDDEDGDWFRPVWEDEDPSPPLSRSPVRARPAPARPAHAAPRPPDLAPLLGPLCAAQDALARLDAKAESAPEPLRTGLIARLAFREAAGWLSYAGCWAHPRDLALRDAHLIGFGEFPNTPGHHWEEMEPELRLLAEGHLQEALHFARLLRRLAGFPRLLADPESCAAALGPLAGPCDPERIQAWRERWTAGGARPALLQAAAASVDWMESGVASRPSSLAALAAVAGRLAEARVLQAVPLPFWSGAATLAAGEPMLLPRLRGDVAARVFPDGAPGWEGTFVALAGEAARAGLQNLARLQNAAHKGSELIAGLDRRARMPAALDAVLRTPAVTARGLAASLRITPQAALRLLGELVEAGVVRETTGRRSFRAFATR